MASAWLHSPYNLEDLIGGDKLGRDDAVQSDSPGDTGVVLAVGFGHHLGDPLLQGIERDDEIVLVAVGEGDEGIGGPDILRLQQLLIRSVPADDHGAGEHLAQMAAALHTPFHDLYAHAKVLQHGGEIV